MIPTGIFSSADRVLVYLLHKAERDEVSGGGADQDEISSFCGIGRTHVHRTLRPLMSDGLVREDMGRVPGRPRRVKLYFLTQTGSGTARELRHKVNEHELRWRDETGNEYMDRFVDSVRRINDRLGQLSLKAVPLSLMLTLEKETLTWSDILWLSSSVRGDEAVGVCIPEGWEPVNPPEIPSGYIPRPSLEVRLGELLRKEKTIVLAGESGTGKRTLVAKWVRDSGRRCLWLAKGSQDRDICLEESGYDLLVLTGVQAVDKHSTLSSGGRLAIMDPRDDSWPRQLMSLPAVAIQDGDIGMEGEALLRMIGVGKDDFIKTAGKQGLDPAISGELWAAVKGSPGMLSYLGSMDPVKLGALGQQDVESALMALLIGYRSRI